MQDREPTFSADGGNRLYLLQPLNPGTFSHSDLAALQREMYLRFGVNTKTVRCDYRDRKPLLTPTDPTDILAEQLEILNGSMKINSVLTVMGSAWPTFFHRFFPYAPIHSFDINIQQIVYSGKQAAQFGEVYLADINVPIILATLLQKTQPDLFYASNIFDRSNPTEQTAAAKVFTSYGGLMLFSEVPAYYGFLEERLRENFWDEFMSFGFDLTTYSHPSDASRITVVSKG